MNLVAGCSSPPSRSQDTDRKERSTGRASLTRERQKPVQTKPSRKPPPPARLAVPIKHETETPELHQERVIFVPSDRIWGHLSLPSNSVGLLHKNLRAKKEASTDQPFTINLYGDSHTQGGYLSRALAEIISDELSGDKEESTLSPGWVTVGHPTHGPAKVKSQGFWLRQNWLYSSDQGPYGPLGIAFVTQDAAAKMTVEAEHTATSVVTFYFEQTGRELPFCLQVIPSKQEKQPSTKFRKPSTTPAETVCHQPNKESEHSLGQLQLNLEPGQKLELALTEGMTISQSLIQQRKKSLKRAKSKRAQLRRKYPRLSKSQISKKLRLPTYAQYPHLINPVRPHLRVYGFHIRTKDAQVEVNSMGVRGATIWSPTTQSDASLYAWNTESKPQLIALWYGTNTAARERTHLQRYQSRYRLFLKELKKTNPHAACLVIAPPDFRRRSRDCYLTKRQRRLLARRSKHPKFLSELSASRHARVCRPDELINHRKKGRHRFPVPEAKTMSEWRSYKETCEYRTPTLLIDLITIQKEVALSEGCAFYDTFQAMGGEGGMQVWACSEDERWAQYDLVHLTPNGYRGLGERIGLGLTSTLLTLPIAPPPLGPNEGLDLLDDPPSLSSSY